MISLDVYSPDCASAWDDLVRRGGNGHFMFLRDFIGYHGDRFSDHSYVFRAHGKVVAALPAHSEGTTLVSHNGLPFAGLIWLPEVGLGRMGGIFSALVNRMRTDGFTRLIYKPAPLPYQRYPQEAELYLLESYGATIEARKISCALRMGAAPPVKGSRRHVIKKALEQGLQVVSDVDIATVHAMHSRFIKARFDAQPLHTLQELTLLARRFPEEMLTFGVVDGDELVQVTLAFLSQDTLRIQFVGATDHGIRLHATDLVYDWLIKQPQYQGKWLDFGTSMDPGTGLLSDSLHWYKETFGARTILQRTYQLELAI